MHNADLFRKSREAQTAKAERIVKRIRKATCPKAKAKLDKKLEGVNVLIQMFGGKEVVVGRTMEELHEECESNWNQILEASSKEEKNKLLIAGAKLRMERYYLRHGLEWPPKQQTKEGAL